MNNEDIFKILSRARWVLALICVGLAAFYALAFRDLPALPSTSPTSQVKLPTWPDIQQTPDAAWTVFKRDPVSASEFVVEERFRLAGTFFNYGDTGTGTRQHIRKAILDDLQNQQQSEVREGDRIAEFAVTQIFHDHVTIERDGRAYKLYLSYAKNTAGVRPAEQVKETEPPPLEISRFGKRIDEVRYIMSREALETYYEEVREDPERMANIYLSLKPVYESEEIEGYVLDTAGEAELFKAFGVQDGDIIRRVNSIRMVSQRRAEYLLGEFVKNNLNIFDFDIERNGERKKIIHLIR